MLEAIISSIQDPDDYFTALSQLRREGPLTKADAETLLVLHEKYLPDAAEDTSYARLYLASTMLQEGAADVLELPEDERDALLMVRGVVSKEAVIDVQQAGAVIDLIRNDGVSPLLRGMLARAELDILVRSGGWQDLREEIMTLAEFLSGYTADQMDRCTGLLMEVRSRCGKM